MPPRRPSHVEFLNVLNKSGKEEKVEKLFFSWLIKGWTNAYIKFHRNSRLVDVPVMTAKGKNVIRETLT